MKINKNLFLFIVVSIILSLYSSCSRYEQEKKEKKVEGVMESYSISSKEIPTSEEVAVNDSFPWPPPLPSAFHKIPRNFLIKSEDNTLFQDVANELERALNNAGYTEIKWYWGEYGFVVVSRLEQFHPDGRPFKKNRWSVEISPSEEFSLSSMIKSLFNATPGHFRVIVFVVTEQLLTFGEQVDRKEAIGWLERGYDRLNSDVGLKPFTKEHQCTALIYEFHKPKGRKPFFKYPSGLPGKIHLQKANIIK